MICPFLLKILKYVFFCYKNYLFLAGFHIFLYKTARTIELQTFYSILNCFLSFGWNLFSWNKKNHFTLFCLTLKLWSQLYKFSSKHTKLCSIHNFLIIFWQLFRKQCVMFTYAFLIKAFISKQFNALHTCRKSKNVILQNIW